MKELKEVCKMRGIEKEKTAEEFEAEHPCNLCDNYGDGASLQVFDVDGNWADAFDYCKKHATEMLALLEKNGFIKQME